MTAMITVGNKTFEVAAHEIKIDSTYDPYESIIGSQLSRLPELITPQQTFTLVGTLNKVTIGKIMANMFDQTQCEDGSYATELERKINNLDLDEDEKLLRDYGLVNDDGLLNNRGKNVLLAVLAKDKSNRKLLIDAVRKVEASEKKEQ